MNLLTTLAASGTLALVTLGMSPGIAAAQPCDNCPLTSGSWTQGSQGLYVIGSSTGYDSVLAAGTSLSAGAWNNAGMANFWGDSSFSGTGIEIVSTLPNGAAGRYCYSGSSCDGGDPDGRIQISASWLGSALQGQSEQMQTQMVASVMGNELGHVLGWDDFFTSNCSNSVMAEAHAWSIWGPTAADQCWYEDIWGECPGCIPPANVASTARRFGIPITPRVGGGK